ncbi:Rho-type gtpase-activating protein [Paramarasmius palmivorus]|uniref:Rho-type gtpase-activating protein n=1 Tax=Paramarasmius palmivorus TaxID=297713 RepID=A0AAW0C9J9_9AGAR
MLAAMQAHHQVHDMSQQQFAEALPSVEDRICPGCKLSAVTEEGGLVVAFGNKVTADTNLLLLSDGSPICANCSYSCNVCHLPILDEAIMTGDDSYHAHCFKCKICQSRIDELVFAKTSQGIYCMNCHNQRMIKIRKHAQKKAEKEKAAAAAGGSNSTSSRERDARLRSRGSEASSSPSGDPRDLPNPSKSASASGSGLSDQPRRQSGSSATDTHQNGRLTDKGSAKSSTSSSSSQPTFFIRLHEPRRWTRPLLPRNSLPSYPFTTDDHERRRASSYDEFSHPGLGQRASSGSMDIPSISVPNGNGAVQGLSVTSRAEKRRSINPGLSLNNFGVVSEDTTPSYPPSLSPLSATFIGKQASNRSATQSQNGRDSPRASSPFRDRFSDNEPSRPTSSQSSTNSHSTASNHDPDYENTASRMRSVSTTAAMSDDQTVVLRPTLRTNATSDALPTRQTQSSHGRASPASLRLQRSFDDRTNTREQITSQHRSRSASRSRPNSRADVPQSVESATESETDHETHESIGSMPPALPPKEDPIQIREDDGNAVQPLADLLSLQSDGDPNSSQIDSDDNTSESSPVEQTSHATFIAPALPPIRFSLNAGDFSDIFNSVGGLPQLQQLAQLASVTERKVESEEEHRIPSTPPPTAASVSLATKGSFSAETRGPEEINGKTVAPSAPTLLDRSQSASSSVPRQIDNVTSGRGRALSEAQAEPLKADSTARITISPPQDAHDKQEKPDPTDQVLQRLQEVMVDARERGAQQLKLDRGFVEAIIKAMASRKADYTELKGSLDGMKRASKQYMEGLTVAQAEYDRELKARRELEAEVTRLRVLLSGQAARLTALSGDSRRQELRQQMTKELHESLSGLEQDLSKLKVERDMTLAEVEELSATRTSSVTPEPATVSNLSRSLTKRLDNLKAQYQRDLVPLTQEREALSREIMELRAARDVYLEETTVLNARNEELAQLSAQYARRMASGPEPTKSQDPRNRERAVAGEKDAPKPPAILQQPLPQHTGVTHATPTFQNSHVASQPSQGLANRPPIQSQYLQPAVTTYGQEEVADPRYGKVQATVEGTPSKTPRFGMKWPVSKAKDMATQASFSDLKAKTTMEHNFQPLSLLRFTRCDHCGDKMWGSQLRCTGCNISVHTRCVSHVQTYCSQQSLLTQEEVQSMPPSMFGRDLVGQVRSDARGGARFVPVIVEKCIEAVEAIGMDYEGIYRKTGGSGQSRIITQLFERGNYDAFDLRDQEKFNDICSVTSVLKTYLRNLPDPLLTHDLHDHFMSAVEIKDMTTKDNTLTELVNKLPPEHYYTLRALMLHLHRVRERSEVNLMNARNLGVVFGPTLMRSRNPGAEFSDMAGKALTIEGPNNPSASLSSPTETHAAAAGIFRSSGSPPWLLEECETDDIVSELSIDEDDEAIEIDETFTKHAPFPGTVKIVVESTTFWAHKEVLFFASPFFEAALSGNWAETGRPPSMSSVITISQPPSVPSPSNRSREVPTEMTFTPMEDGEDSDVIQDVDIVKLDGHTASSDTDGSDTESARVRARDDSLAKLQSAAPSSPPMSPPPPTSPKSTTSPVQTKPSSIRKPVRAAIKRRPNNGPDAVVVLKEERRECLRFLLTHAAGKPIKAMRIAELFEEEDLYRESSRFVLDNPGGWSEHELNTLSQGTLLKLEKRQVVLRTHTFLYLTKFTSRSWFLERVLKIGLTMVAKEYQCCATCPDPANCARLLEEKWRQAYHAVFRFGPPQPSMVYRYLRMLEGVSPPLSLTHLSCQTTAKAFIATREANFRRRV